MELYFGDLTKNRIDIARARRQRSLVGDPLLAPAGSNYPEGYHVDSFCLACGYTFCSHDDDSDCWRVLVPKWKLWIYDLCGTIRNWIER